LSATAVNVASRLQALTKELDRSVLANSEAARRAAGVARLTDVGEFTVRGKTRPVPVLAVEAAADVTVR
jgi:class 3 adenylate cyclase